MQRQRVYAALGVTFLFLSAVSAFAQGAPRPPIRVETFYPRHAGRGQTTVINVAIPSPEPVQAAEVSPSTGVTVSSIKGSGSGSEQNIGWWEISLDVAKDAEPGDRSLVLVMRTARTEPTRVSIATHVPAISNLRIAPGSNPATLELSLAVADTAADLGDSPYVWFTADCGGEPIVGALRSKVGTGVVRAALPKLNGKCDLQVRLTDSNGIESNMLKTAVESAK